MNPKTLKVSSENQWFQRAEVIKRNRKKRHRYQQFLVEGVWSIDQIAASDAWNVVAYLYSVERRLSDWARGILSNSRALWHLELRDALMQKLSDKEEGSELMAIVEMPPDDPLRSAIREDALIVIVDRPASPGNLGTLIRSCDAFGVQGMVITGHAVDLFDPRTIRAAAGSFFVLPVLRLFQREELTSWLGEIRLRIPELQLIGTSAHAQMHVASCDFTRPTVLVVGNESRGISRWFRDDVCDVIAGIPITGTTPSLNVACAATAILYEIQRQRSGVG